MDGTGHFNRLVSELTLEERTKLLEKLKSQSTLQQGPLYEEISDEPEEKIESRFNSLPWYRRFWFRILSFFNSRAPLKLFEDYLMSRISRSLEETAPGFYNYQKDLLLPKFQEMLVYLRDGSRFFYQILDSSFNRDKGGLMVFLGSLEMPDIHRLIQNSTDPSVLVGQFPGISEVELRQKAHRAMEEAVAAINDEQRSVMYQNTRSLFCLKQLSSFLFDRMINAFIVDSAYHGSICPAASIRDQLLVLNNILNSLKDPPPLTLLGSLFVFVLSEKRDEPGFDIQIEMRKLLSRTEASVEAIRTFNKQVPLTRLLRCMSRDMGISPQNIGGGEDWFVVYREHWKQLIDDRFSVFIKNKRQKDMQNSLRYFFKGNSLKVLENTGNESDPTDVPIKEAFCLSFLQTFYTVVFMGEINKILRPILIDGEFIKKENRTEFAEYYNTIIKLEDLIRHFDQTLSKNGDFGQRYLQAKAEMTSLPIKRRKIQIVLQEASRAAEKIIDQTKDAIKGMITVLGGIIRKSADDKYDSLANVTVFGRPAAFFGNLQLCIDQLQKAMRLMDDINSIENAK
ncbi:MAG: DUF5312 domain-containing protein [Treponema sp.]|jgi:hypothetical protein|nr:DUF5312 domain-containing protein [Treponema sp.]